jgi:hypothetical protein
MKLRKAEYIAIVLATAILLISFRSSESRALSQLCSGWLPEDCRGIHGCKNCWDNYRLDCFPETNNTFTYGNLWCESHASNGICDGKSEADCGSQEGCVYCKSAAVGNQCYKTDDARKLPTAIFTCEWPEWATVSSGPPDDAFTAF